MLHDVDKLRREWERVRRFGRAALTPAPGAPPIEVSPGEEVRFTYGGEARHVRVLAWVSGGLLAHDLERGAVRRFRLDRIGTGGPTSSPQE